jgi:hypothetical protein
MRRGPDLSGGTSSVSAFGCLAAIIATPYRQPIRPTAKSSFDRVIWICASHAIPGGTSNTAFFGALLLLGLVLCCGIAAGSSLRFIRKSEAKGAALRNPVIERKRTPRADCV